VRAFYEPRFGQDFSGVRVHTDAKAAEAARAANARAFTVGQDVLFGKGEYAPDTMAGKQFLAHELVHTLQQDSVRDGQSTCQMTIFRAPKKEKAKKTKPDQVIVIRINLTAGQVTFVTSSGTKYEGDVDTDLEPGSYKLIPDVAAKKWSIPGTKTGMRFFVDLEDADPWALVYSKELKIEVVQGTKEDIPIGKIIDIENTVPIEGDPVNHTNYVQNAIKGVGIFGWGGPFRLDRKIVDGMGVDSFYLPRSEFNLDSDPLKGFSGYLKNVYKSRASADAALKAFGVSGLWDKISFYFTLCQALG
jgi:hypothetical protein